MNSKLFCLLTNDVETTSILNHRLRDETGKLVTEKTMPELLRLYDKYNVKSTFFFTGYFAERFPEAVKMIIPYGHEVGSHGYSHDVDKAFDILPLSKQIEHLNKSKQILEDIAGQEIVSFRAPASRVNQDTSHALQEAGFKIDSSVSSQRFDMFFSFGSIKKLNWILAPRLPYFTSSQNIWKRGDGSILEIPISAFFFPYIGTFMRAFPLLSQATRNILHVESLINGKPIVFLTHPNEFVDEKLEHEKIHRRSKKFISYMLKDVFRHKLKIRNLGKKALPIYEKEISFFRRHKYKFVTCKEYYDEFINNRQ